MKFSVEDFFSKCDQIRSFLQIGSYLLKKSLMENFIFLCSENNLLYYIVAFSSPFTSGFNELLTSKSALKVIPEIKFTVKLLNLLSMTKIQIFVGSSN